MFLAKIVGKVVSVTKNEGLHGKKILIAVPLNMNGEAVGGEIVSLDNEKDYPIDSAIISIVDSVEQS